jgi:hypothetical protein
VGHKKLFLLDEEGKANEMIPQCVLDFYVVGKLSTIDCCDSRQPGSGIVHRNYLL